MTESFYSDSVELYFCFGVWGRLWGYIYRDICLGRGEETASHDGVWVSEEMRVEGSFLCYYQTRKTGICWQVKDSVHAAGQGI